MPVALAEVWRPTISHRGGLISELRRHGHPVSFAKPSMRASPAEEASSSHRRSNSHRAR